VPLEYEVYDEGQELLKLTDDVSADASSSKPVVYGGKSSRVDAGVDTVPLEYEVYDDEYDEELISIFIKKLQTDIEYIQARIAEYRVGGDKKTILRNCHNAIGRLASSANYMEYKSLTGFCETWLSVVDGYLSDISTGAQSDIPAGMQEFIDKLTGVYPQIAGNKKPEEDQDDFDDEDVIGNIFSSDDDDDEEEAVIPEPPRKEKKAERKTKAASQTGAAQETVDESGDKELFDKLSTALDVSEQAADTAADSIDSVIEEIIEASGAENGHDKNSTTGSDMELSQLLDKAGNDGGHPGAHLLDKVVASEEAEDLQENVMGNIPDDVDDDPETEPGVEERSEVAVAADKSEKQPEVPVSSRRSPDFIKSEILKQDEEQEEKEARPAGKAAVRSSIRVDAEKIDYLMNQVGELVVSRAYFAQLVNEMRGLEQQLLESSGVTKAQLKPLHEFSFRLSEAGVHLGRVSNELQEGVMKVRMLPIDQLFKRYPRLVRDLVHNSDKDVKLVTKGEETELDKMVIESISDPMIHIIRNSVDHGIETISERLRAGKPAQGTLMLEAFHESDHIVLEITDDGRGIDTARIKAKA
ncbi:MAG: hypothetical protein D3906_11615, partial [Candidatus Electrothrix sp. AUS1_2]|nr:hypothetical protein [Candidatus Electrothrix sp. AUS1_2]